MRNKIIIAILGLVVAGMVAYKITSLSHVPSRGGEKEGAAESVQDFVNQTFVDNRGADVATSTTPSQPSHRPNTADPSPEPGEGNNVAGAVCTGAEQSDFDCYQLYYQGIVKDQGLAIAFADLRKRYGENSYVQSQCHPLTHVIGNEAAKKFADVADAYAQGDAFCWSGYYHGVLEGIIGRIGLGKLNSQMDDICKSLAQKSRYSFDHYNCVHGLGHGVMAIYDNELFESLEVCDKVSDSWERSSCWSGAFMENVIVDNKYHFSKYLKPEDPLYPCNAVGENYRGICYLMQTSYMLKVTNGDFARVFELCSTVEEIHRNTCYQSLGRDVSGRSLSNVAQTKLNCGLGKTIDQREHCIIGAVKDFISYLHDDVRAKELCEVMDEQKLKDTCYSTADSYYKLF
ncbi:MAG: hypothetical protein A2751_03820 [Candidatus Doudnabacteria bacterium RIFCSPHIGHO2_01_FULL_46_14]|uniref:Uncharacterized protein n=1 Tax=Candidatus Doudnabacteria bacterium RIFCSPHIGHO2_01_FULL_46_14 TaxID=1817824 RepID=A0A1F5NL64_9BACT|nr:MAG: hypothetical protein A2751_03820 [Candidatus Doudnabacteria bacterium RIFCSPHIGHO2_01_FULL_46_14]